MTIRKAVAAAGAALVLGVATTSGTAALADTVTMSGSTSIAPLATQLAKAFVGTKAGDGVKFVVLQGGSDIGITDVSRGRVTLGMSSRDPKSADPGGIVFNKFARDSVCIVTHPDNKVENISQKQIQDIFSGRITSWSQVDGADVNGTINLVVRTPASGTQDAFQNIYMGEDLRVAGSADPEPTNGLQAQAIGANPNAIGYASFSFTKNLHTIPYAGVPCTLRTAQSGEYGGTRNFYFVSRGPIKGSAKKFLKFTKSNGKAQNIISSNWVPLK